MRCFEAFVISLWVVFGQFSVMPPVRFVLFAWVVLVLCMLVVRWCGGLL